MPVLPPLPGKGDCTAQNPVYIRWITTTIYTLSGATATLAQAIVVHHERVHRRACHAAHAPGGAAQPPGAATEVQQTAVQNALEASPSGILLQPDSDHEDDQPDGNTKPALPNEKEDGDLLLATCAEHLRHVARTVQQLMSMLGTHLDTTLAEQCTNLPLEEDC